MALEVRLSLSPLSSSAPQLTRFSPYAGRATSAGRRRRRSGHRSLQRGMSRRALSLPFPSLCASFFPVSRRLELLNSKPLFTLTQDYQDGVRGGGARVRGERVRLLRPSLVSSSLGTVAAPTSMRSPSAVVTASRHLQEHVGLALPVTLPPARCRRLSVRISRKLESFAGVRSSAMLLSSSSCARCGTSCFLSVLSFPCSASRRRGPCNERDVLDLLRRCETFRSSLS